MEKTPATPSSRGSVSSSTSSRKMNDKSPKELKPVSHKTIDIRSTTETADVQFELEKARFEKKREIKMKQFGKYATAVYGTQTEKEQLRLSKL